MQFVFMGKVAYICKNNNHENITMKHKIKVVMLPTQETQFRGILQRIPYYEGENFAPKLQINMSPTLQVKELLYLKPQHVYFTVSQDVEPIKEGDWYYESEHRRILKCNTDVQERAVNTWVDCRKIIATDDKSLGLNGIPQSFIEEYCKVGGIDEVLLEYVVTNRCCGRCDGVVDLCWVDQECDKHNVTDCLECFPLKGNVSSLKLNPDNTVNITAVEEKMYSRKEIDKWKYEKILTQLLETLREKAKTCGTKTKESRARKGAYVDCIIEIANEIHNSKR